MYFVVAAKKDTVGLSERFDVNETLYRHDHNNTSGSGKRNCTSTLTSDRTEEHRQITKNKHRHTGPPRISKKICRGDLKGRVHSSDTPDWRSTQRTHNNKTTISTTTEGAPTSKSPDSIGDAHINLGKQSLLLCLSIVYLICLISDLLQKNYMAISLRN